jgi:hypothetical protein
VPWRPAFAASKNDLISVGSRKSLGRCGSVTSELLTLSGLAISSMAPISFGFLRSREGNSQQNYDNVELPSPLRSVAIQPLFWMLLQILRNELA